MIGADGEKIGTIEHVYLDNGTDRPAWVAIKTGWFGRNISLVPIAQATEVGGDLQVPFEKERVSSAPHQDPGHDISEIDEQALYRHYGLDYGSEYSRARVEPATSAGEVSAPGGIRGAPGGDDAMTRSQEELHVGKEQVPGRPGATPQVRRHGERSADGARLA